MAPKMAPKMSGEITAGRLCPPPFWHPGAQVDSCIHFGRLFALIWLPLAPLWSLLAPFCFSWALFSAPFGQIFMSLSCFLFIFQIFFIAVAASFCQLLAIKCFVYATSFQRCRRSLCVYNHPFGYHFPEKWLPKVRSFPGGALPGPTLDPTTPEKHPSSHFINFG